jgi:hypothetical protein
MMITDGVTNRIFSLIKGESVMPKIHLWKEELVKDDRDTTASITIEYPNGKRMLLWYRVPSNYGNRLTPSCDPFVIATIFSAMSRGADLVVHGEVSPSLLQNLTEFQVVWATWSPQHYTPVEIIPEVEREAVKAEGGAIASFSGGVDSCFTALRHRKRYCGRYQRDIKAGLMVHGFDIPLTEQEVFERAADKSRKILASLGVELIPMATNFREFKLDWEDVFGTGVASCLMLLQGGYSTGLIASSAAYNELLIPYGSNPITDPLLSSQAFQIICDASGLNRLQKVREIGNWPEALTFLRVCWQGTKKDQNCGKCEKCIRTILSFRVMGLGLPSCFEEDLTNKDILSIKGLQSPQLTELYPILEAAKSAKIDDSWVMALEQCIERNRYRAKRHTGKDALKNILSSYLKKWRK